MNSPNNIFRRRPPLLRRVSIIPGFDFEEPEPENELVNRIRTRLSSNSNSNDSEISELENLLKENRKQKSELERYKRNYRNMMDNIPKNVVKNLVKRDRMCSICLEDSSEFDTNYILTSCFHIFHEKCIKESHSSLSTRCPLCRHDLKFSFYKKFQIDVKTNDTQFFE